MQASVVVSFISTVTWLTCYSIDHSIDLREDRHLLNLSPQFMDSSKSDESEKPTCLFKQFTPSCGKQKDELKPIGDARLQKTLSASQIREDDLLSGVHLNADTIYCHRNCYSSYSSLNKLQRVQKRKKSSVSTVIEPLTKKVTRSAVDTFNQKEECLFCGKKAIESNVAQKNPSQMGRVDICRGDSSTKFKDEIISACHIRKDAQANDILVRIGGVGSDLAAGDVRYHRTCRISFLGKNVLSSFSKRETPQQEENLIKFFKNMRNFPDASWTLQELCHKYEEFSENAISKYKMLSEIKSFFGQEVIPISSPGVATLIMFREKAGSLLRLVEDHSQDEVCGLIKPLAKKIRNEIFQVKRDTKIYTTRVNKTSIMEQCSPTFSQLLNEISPTFCDSPSSLMVGSIVSSKVTKHPTDLQIALGTFLGTKSLIESLSKFGVCCSYPEVNIFKKSAAIATLNKLKDYQIFDSKDGMVQFSVDNYDSVISSPNGLKQTHALASIVWQSPRNPMDKLQPFESCISRVTNENVPVKCLSPTLKYYQGTKNPPMPAQFVKSMNASENVSVLQKNSKIRAEELDFHFFKNISLDAEKTPEYGGHLVRSCRDQKHSIQASTNIRYLPLKDEKPNDHSTIKTSMHEAIIMTTACGQYFVVYTADLQIYRLAVDNIWVDPQNFPNFYPVLGMMHWKMSFIGCIGVLMAESGIETVLKSSFGGVEKMLVGKKFPQNERALRILVEELLNRHLQNIENVEELKIFMQSISSKSKTSKHWVENLIKPLFLLMQLHRAERESDWPLQLLVCKEMLPFFFAAGHHNYARLGCYYLMQMNNLPSDVEKHFIKGEHTLRFRPGYANAISGDQGIESSYMKHGHGYKGLTGITLNDNARAIWALSQHHCVRLHADIIDISTGDDCNSVVTKHKEEFESRIKSDANDRKNIRNMLKTCVDPLDPVGHPIDIFNIVNGKKVHSSVNVEQSYEIGSKALENFQKGLPETYYNTLTSTVITMASKKRNLVMNKNMMPDPSKIFSRALGLVTTGAITANEMFQYELAPYPTALFQNHGTEMRSTPKHKLKNTLQVTTSLRNLDKPDVCIIDGCALLYCIEWPPKSAKVSEITYSIKKYIEAKLNTADVCLIFDRYQEFSPKGWTRDIRCKSDLTFHINSESMLPSQTAMLTVTENKIQLIEVICNSLPSLIQEFQKNNECSNQFLLIGPEKTPISVHLSVKINRNDLEIHHEEADTMIVNLSIHAFKILNKKVVHVYCEDTDVFVLLLHFYHSENINGTCVMRSLGAANNVIDIGKTVQQNVNIIPHLISLHALTGCDSVCAYKTIGKIKALNVLKKGIVPPCLGTGNFKFDETIKFITKCYGLNDVSDMASARYNVWVNKTKSKSKSILLEDMPPTENCLKENVKRAEYQAAVWRAALQDTLPSLNQKSHGWIKSDDDKSLIPCFSSEKLLVMPEKLENLLSCSCSGDSPCSKGQCGCKKLCLPCTIFCQCHQVGCSSQFTKDNIILEDDGEDDFNENYPSDADD